MPFLLKRKLKELFKIIWHFNFIDCRSCPKYQHSREILEHSLYWLYLHQPKRVLAFCRSGSPSERAVLFQGSRFETGRSSFDAAGVSPCPQALSSLPYEAWKVGISAGAEGCPRTLQIRGLETHPAWGTRIAPGWRPLCSVQGEARHQIKTFPSPHSQSTTDQAN